VRCCATANRRRVGVATAASAPTAVTERRPLVKPGYPRTAVATRNAGSGTVAASCVTPITGGASTAVQRDTSGNGRRSSTMRSRIVAIGSSSGTRTTGAPVVRRTTIAKPGVVDEIDAGPLG